MRTKILAAFLIVIFVLVLLMNSVPLVQARNMIFTSKEQSLKSQALIIGTSLAALDIFTADSVGQAMSLMDVSGMGRVIVTDSYGNWLYEEISGTEQPAYDTIDWCIKGALTGEDCVWLRLESGVFYSSFSIPVVSEGLVAGTVYLFEADRTQGELLDNLRSTLVRASVAMCAAALVISALLSETITRRIRQILEGIKQVRSGEYSYRVKVTGRDEVSHLGNEFNSLSERLQRTEEVRRRFVSDASHELKTPLAAIRLLSDSILQNPEIDAETSREFVSDIGSEAERLARTTDKLLRLTRLDNRIEGQVDRVELGEVVNSALRILRPLAAENNVSLMYKNEGSACVMANKDDIYQIVFNLVENAIKYNVPGGQVEIVTDVEGDKCSFAVLDTGIGIPEKDIPYIFDRFYRVDKARSREAGGSGLGLSIVRDLVREYGGEISVKKREYAGMEFRADFPAA